jgi:photosystem II stability/assembly factor-like uncharacterized protein
VGSGSRTASESAADQHDVIDMTSNGGASWSQQSLPISTPSALSSISCVDARYCMAVGDQLGTTSTGAALAGTVLVTSDGGHRWDPATSPPGSVDVVGVSCSTAQYCLVLATDGSSIWSATTTDGGEAWSRGGSLPAGFAGVSGVDCPQLSTCVVAGYLPAKPGHGTGAVADTSDAGVTWQAATLPSGIGLLHDVSCPDLQRCVAVGTLSTTDSDVVPGKGVLLTSTDGGRTFGAPRSPSFIDDAFGVSCPVSSRCVAVGTRWAQTTPPTPFAAVATTADRGSTWRSAKARFVPFGLAAVACPTATTCVAVGGDLVAALRWPAPTR